MEPISDFDRLRIGVRESDFRQFVAVFEEHRLKTLLDYLQNEPLQRLEKDLKNSISGGQKSPKMDALLNSCFSGYGEGVRNALETEIDMEKLGISDFLLGYLVFHYVNYIIHKGTMCDNIDLFLLFEGEVGRVGLEGLRQMNETLESIEKPPEM